MDNDLKMTRHMLDVHQQNTSPILEFIALDSSILRCKFLILYDP
jgi:hypothetical protein